MPKKITLSFLAVFLAISACQAQVPSISPFNVVVPAIFNAAGGTYDNASSYNRFEWSMGESILVQFFAPPDSSVLLTQGVLQPCTDQLTKQLQTSDFEKGDYRLFPNPTSSKFELDFFVKIPGTMSLQLVDATGRVMEKKSYYYNGCCKIEMYDMTKYPNGIYYVIADLKPDAPGHDGTVEIRHSGFKIVKVGQ